MHPNDLCFVFGHIPAKVRAIRQIPHPFWVLKLAPMKIGILSDTHSYMDDRIPAYLEDRDEIWHIGDFGNYEVVEQLQQVAPLQGVYGNIDGQPIRQEFPEHQRFERAGLDIWMTHIGGYPGKYERHIRDPIRQHPPDLFLSGHSHILKVMRDTRLNLMHLNPGAAGKTGFHKERTLLLMEIADRRITNLRVVELGKRGKKAAQD